MFQATKMSLSPFVTHYVLLPLLFLSQLVLYSAQNSTQHDSCSAFNCGRLGIISYPFFRNEDPRCGGLIALNCTASEPKAQFGGKGKWYPVKYINYSDRRFEIHDEVVETHLVSNRCDLLGNFSEEEYLKSFSEHESPYFISFNFREIRPFFKCKHKPNITPTFFNQFAHYNCTDYDLYYEKHEEKLPFLPGNLSDGCSVVHLPPAGVPGYNPVGVQDNLTLHWDANFTIDWKILQACVECVDKGGKCPTTPNQSFQCSTDNKKKNASGKNDVNVGGKVAIGLGAGVGSILLTCIVFIIYKCLKRNRSSSSSALISRDLSRDNSLKPDPEKGSLFFQTKLFTYKELDEATNHFDSNKELGGGGFGTVYHGKLRDGRVVAVKRLFEHNCKQVEQFTNEIAILSQLHHKNLVPLYGCTSRHSRELLLVYEFVPNGTLADHIHGKRAEDGLLTWPIRMSIAIESADALAYLHASEVIHRDVKSSNILLDNHFHVKVADFGLSRLFPTNVTHISTAPQGTPGYVDPEYYRSYQLSNRSDVYSFGVVLIELISSKPAVDISRNRHEINLASMAVNRIHSQALHELVDPSLGYDTDYSVRNMINLVAELAFRCLQQDNEMRPSMTEILEILRGIENETDDIDTSAVAQLLKNRGPLSSDTDTGKWSSDATPNTSS